LLLAAIDPLATSPTSIIPLMRNGLRRLTMFGALLCELIVLVMFYSATMLDPLPFDWVRITSILVTGAISGAFAYVSSSSLSGRAKREALTWKQLVIRPPFIIWIVAVGFTAVQFLGALNMWLMATKK
jgi:hypothetical protein